jgi:hypothetical protein
MIATKGLWYMAHPYTSIDAEGRFVPEAEDANFQLANHRAAELLKRGYNIYSPISHTHPIHRACPEFLGNREHEMWYHLDNDLISRTNFDGIILPPGWQESKGCCAERELFEAAGKAIKHYNVIMNEPVEYGV